MDHLEGVITEMERFGEDPVQEVKDRLLYEDHQGTCQEYGSRFGFSETFSRDDSRFLKELLGNGFSVGAIEYCETFYATKEAQWQIIRGAVEELAETRPLAASRYHEAFGDLEQALNLKEDHIFGISPKNVSDMFGIRSLVLRLVGKYSEIEESGKAALLLARYNEFCENEKDPNLFRDFLPEEKVLHAEGLEVRGGYWKNYVPADFQLRIEECVSGEF
jgi:hypothetical protein